MNESKSWGVLTPDYATDETPETPWSDVGGFQSDCTLCHETKDCHEHHTSYDPEKTRTVCVDCHYRIHNKDGYFDRLDPTNSYFEEKHAKALKKSGYFD